MSDEIKYKKLSPEEADYIRSKYGRGHRKSKLAEIFKDMQIGDMIIIYDKVNRGTVAKIGQKLGMKLSVHLIEGHYVVERIA